MPHQPNIIIMGMVLGMSVGNLGIITIKEGGRIIGTQNGLPVSVRYGVGVFRLGKNGSGMLSEQQGVPHRWVGA